ncbi:MAG: hypothetical protein H0T76_17885 [Nannocystis sp.]|nr:hypothetical protein [Nannocystis sp.]MBA3548356.1 hypothetical protein [Nannocystis sp.]
MSTPPRPAASDSLIALIQPYVDDDLPADERARVDAVLAEDPVLREMVEEQCSVRQALRSLPLASAPQALQARVLLELDAIDREQVALERERVTGAPRWSRWRSFFRGAAVMVPAGATALAMFLMVRTGTHSDAPLAATPAASDAMSALTLARPEFRLDQAPLVLGSGAAEASPGVRLVGASLGSRSFGAADPAVNGPQAPHMVELRVGSRRILDRQEPAGGPPPGPAHDHRGKRFWLGTIEGQPAVSFETEGLRHTLTRLGPGFTDEQEYMFLLSLGHAMR